MKIIGIFLNDINENTLECIHYLKQFFPTTEYSFRIYKNQQNVVENQRLKIYNIDFFEKIDDIQNIIFVISIGGDGTFLRTAHFITRYNIPIVGINQGRMGFLADISKNEIEHFAKMIIENNYSIEERPFIELCTTNGFLEEDNYALNEISITKKDSTHLMTIHTWINDEFLNSFWADGIMIATPTGSTAYSLSIGGPILTPTSKNLIINTIAPHSLTVRPIVIPDDSEIILKIEGRDNTYNISLDSRTESFEMSSIFKIKKSNKTLKIIKINDNSYFKTLRNKLMWGLDIRN